MLATWLKQHPGQARFLVFVLGCMPLTWLVWHYLHDTLGPNPLDTITAVTGLAALYFLWLSLLVTPLRRWLSQVAQWRQWRFGKRVADWNTLVRLRRPLGLWSFFYALCHMMVYLEFDSGWSASAFWSSVAEKPFLMIGSLALLLLVPLAATSPTAIARRMGRNWLKLHRSVYLVAVLVLLHYWMQTRADSFAWMPEALMLSVLLGYRLAVTQGWIDRWAGQNGLEAPDRGQSQASMPNQ